MSHFNVETTSNTAGGLGFLWDILLTNRNQAINKTRLKRVSRWAWFASYFPTDAHVVGRPQLSLPPCLASMLCWRPRQPLGPGWRARCHPKSTWQVLIQHSTHILLFVLGAALKVAGWADYSRLGENSKGCSTIRLRSHDLKQIRRLNFIQLKPHFFLSVRGGAAFQMPPLLT